MLPIKPRTESIQVICGIYILLAHPQLFRAHYALRFCSVHVSSVDELLTYRAALLAKLTVAGKLVLPMNLN